MKAYEPEWRAGCPLHFHDTYSAGGKGCVCPKAVAAHYRRSQLFRAGLIPSRKIDPQGTVRRVRALIALGWSPASIGAEVGLSGPRIHGLATVPRSYVLQMTADRVAAVYSRLCMTPGTSLRSKNAAKRNGWVPPLAWDDIDHDEHPVVMAIQRGRGRTNQLSVEEIRHLRGYGMSAFDIADKLGVKVESLERAAHRAGDRRLASALHADGTSYGRATA
jgi:hypothetical protein